MREALCELLWVYLSLPEALPYVQGMCVSHTVLILVIVVVLVLASVLVLVVAPVTEVEVAM